MPSFMQLDYHTHTSYIIYTLLLFTFMHTYSLITLTILQGEKRRRNKNRHLENVQPEHTAISVMKTYEVSRLSLVVAQ